MRITNNLSYAAFVLAAVMAASGCSSDKKKDSATTTAPVTSNAPITSTNPNSPRMGGTVRQSNMATPRGEHTATSTPNGVMVIGGESNGATSNSVERYDNGRWGNVGQLAQARKGHTSTLLSNGKVLVVGGQSDSKGAQVLDSCEIVDPVSGSVQAGPTLNVPRSGHVAVAFRENNSDFVLIAGGASVNGSVNSAEVYDVARNAFIPLPASLSQDRAAAAAALLPNGKILIQGGLTGFNASRLSLNAAGAELFDPATSTFSSAGTMGIDRYGSSMALSDQGRAIVLGGNSAARVEASIESFDPSSSSWSATGAVLNEPRECLSITQLRDTRLLAVGGQNVAVTAAVEAYSPSSDTMELLGDLVTARRDHTATLLANGNVLVVGGYGQNGALSSAEEYNPSAPPGTRPAPIAPLPSTPIGPVGPTTPAMPAPRVLAILPTKGKPGDLITIAGQNFGKSKNDNQVMFMGGAMGKVLYEVKIKRLPILGPVETLIVEVPRGAQTGDVVVIANGQNSPGKNFRIDLNSGGTPSVLMTLPKKASPGGVVSIFGRNFARPASDNIVRFNGEQAQLIGGITTQSVPFLGNLSVMLVRVPTTATSGDLTVEAFTKTSRGKYFEVKGTAAPTSTTPSTPSTPGTTPTTPSTPGTTPSTPSTPSTPGMRVLYSEDFEGANLSVSQQGGLWEAARPGAGSGPGFATSGQWCAGTAMTAGTYSANASGYLISAEVDLTNVTAATLKFNQFFDTDGTDAGRVIVSPDGGTTFYLLRPKAGYLTTTIFNPGEGFTGFSGSWLNTEFDLAAFAGDKITIAFEFQADATSQRSGWFVDDIVVEGR